MPIYEYQCGACGHELEALQKISDSPLRKCPECGKQSLRRVVSPVSFRLKGGGWYETDFKSDAEKKRNLVENAGKESESTTAAETGGSKESGKDAGKDGAAADKPAKAAEPEKKEPSRRSVAVRAASKAESRAHGPKPAAAKPRARAPKKPASATRRKSARA
jgi:putative FmdB family regulatory protein